MRLANKKLILRKNAILFLVNQKGFSAVIILVIILFIIIAGGVYLKSQKDSNKGENKNLEFASSSELKISTPSATIQPSPTIKPTRTVLRTASPTPVSKIDLNLNSSVKLESAFPNPGKDGQQITLKGSNFGSAEGKVWFYSLSGVAEGGPTINKWSDTEVVFTLASFKSGQFYIEIEKADGQKSNKISFTESGGQPHIGSVSPTTFKKGSTITITGTEFGSSSGKLNFYKSQGAGNLMGYGIIGLWNDTQIVFTVPPTLENTEYGFQVITSDGRSSSYKYFNVID